MGETAREKQHKIKKNSIVLIRPGATVEQGLSKFEWPPENVNPATRFIVSCDSPTSAICRAQGFGESNNWGYGYVVARSEDLAVVYVAEGTKKMYEKRYDINDCPFCHAVICNANVGVFDWDEKGGWVRCMMCGATGPDVLHYGEPWERWANTAILKWNTRSRRGGYGSDQLDQARTNDEGNVGEPRSDR